MYFYASLLAAFVITVIVVSKIAQMLLAKRFTFPWVLIASLIGGIAAAVSYVLLSIFVNGIDPMVMLIVSLSTMFLVSSAAFKVINKMSWTSAITTNIANIAVILITMTAAVVLNGKSLEEEFASINSTVKDQMSMVESAATNLQDGIVISEDEMIFENEQSDMTALDGEEATAENLASNDDEFVDEEPIILERDLLSPAAAKALEKKEKVAYIEPKFRSIGVGSLGSLVGQTIRILKSNGNTISGALKSVKGSDVYVAQRISNGIATTPVAIAKIRKLEVYR